MKTDARKDFIFFLMGCQAMTAPKKIQNLMGSDVQEGKKIMADQMHLVLRQLGFPPLTEEEKDYWIRCDEWLKSIHKIGVEKGIIT